MRFKLFLLLLFIPGVFAYQISWQQEIQYRNGSNIESGNWTFSLTDNSNSTTIFNQTFTDAVRVLPSGVSGLDEIMNIPNLVRNKNYSACFYIETQGIPQELLGCEDYLPSTGDIESINVNNINLSGITISSWNDINLTKIENCSITNSCKEIVYETEASVYLKNNTDINISKIYAESYEAETLGYTLTDDGSNLMITSDVGGSNYFSLETTGAYFQLYANPNPSNDYLLASITETQGANTEMNFYEGGTTHNRFWSSGSVRIGGDNGSHCTELTAEVDCNTPTTGADLVVQDDIWLGGQIYSNHVEAKKALYIGNTSTFTEYGNVSYNTARDLIISNNNPESNINIKTTGDGYTNENHVYLVGAKGYVGIGTNTPDKALTVIGGANISQEICATGGITPGHCSDNWKIAYDNVILHYGQGLEYTILTDTLELNIDPNTLDYTVLDALKVKDGVFWKIDSSQTITDQDTVFTGGSTVFDSQEVYFRDSNVTISSINQFTVNESINLTGLDGATNTFLTGRIGEDSYFNTGGKLGINTNDPEEKLQVAGSFLIADGNNDVFQWWEDTSNDISWRIGQRHGLNGELQFTKYNGARTSFQSHALTIQQNNDVQVNSGDLIISNGALEVATTGTFGGNVITESNFIAGVTGTSLGELTLYGDGTSSNEGGQINMHLADDHDGTFASWNIDAYQDDLRIWSSDGVSVHTFTAGGGVNIEGDVTVDDLNVERYIRHVGDTDTYMEFQTDKILFRTGDKLIFDTPTASGFRFNPLKDTDLDFRMDGDTDNYVFYMNAGTNKVGIGTANPSQMLEVVGTVEADGLIIGGSTALISVSSGTADNDKLVTQGYVDDNAGGNFSDGGEAGGADRTLGNTDNYDLGFLTNNNNRLHIQNDGDIGIGTTTPSEKLEITGNLRFTKGATRIIKITNENNVNVGDDLTVEAADGGAGGDLTLNAGEGLGTGGGGDVLINSGDSTGISGGDIKLNAGAKGTIGDDGNIYVGDTTGKLIAQAPTFFAYKNAISAGFTTTAYSIVWDVVQTKDSDFFTHTTGTNAIDLVKAGEYELSYSVPIDVSSGTSRSTSVVWATLNTNAISGSGATAYHRTTGNGDDTASKTIRFTASAGDDFLLRARRLTGGDTLMTQYSATYSITPTIQLRYLG